MNTVGLVIAYFGLKKNLSFEVCKFKKVCDIDASDLSFEDSKSFPFDKCNRKYTLVLITRNFWGGQHFLTSIDEILWQYS